MAQCNSARPSEVVTDAAAIYPTVLNELISSAWHHVGGHANNPIEADHSQLEHRLRPMRGLRIDREFRYYELVAVDSQLDRAQMAELRAPPLAAKPPTAAELSRWVKSDAGAGH